MKKYLLAQIELQGNKYTVSHEFTDQEIEEMLTMPKVGIGVSFKKLYAMRFMENSNGRYLLNTKLIRKKLILFARERGLYIDFEDGELFFNNISGTFH